MSIPVTSAGGRTGKSTVAVGFADEFTRAGRRVSIFRTVVHSKGKQDAILSAPLRHATCNVVRRTAGAVAIGPVLQGLAKPVDDPSRDTTVRDILETAITAVQAQGIL